MELAKLMNSPLFMGLSNEELEKVMADTLYRTRRYRPGGVIAHTGEKVSSLMMVTEGVVKGEMTGYSGRVIKIEEVSAPGAVAAAFLFGRKNYFPVNDIALTTAELMFIEKSSFLRLLMKNDRILVNFLDMISNRSQFLSGKINFLTFKTLKAKLAFYFIQQAEVSGPEFRLTLTQSDMAGLFGVTRPSVARALKEMEEEGLIHAKGKEITILNSEGLSILTVS
jgi:CRP-like cAMP-binding protein